MVYELHIHANAPVLFVDGSYYVFHRYFATLRWFSLRSFNDLSKSEQEEKIQGIHTDHDFMNAFKKHIGQDVKKWRKTWNVPHGNIVFGFDCTRGDIWRHAFHDGYKSTRTASASFNGNIFPAFYTWFEENQESLGLQCVEGSNLEADDVIYLGIQQLRSLQPQIPIIVMTNDNDYLQIKDDGITLINAQYKDIVQRSSVGNAQHDLLIKILMGDVSDNIPSVAPKLGAVTARKIAEQGRAYAESWAETKGVLERFKRNELLISFAHIPSDIASRYNLKYKWVMV